MPRGTRRAGRWTEGQRRVQAPAGRGASWLQLPAPGLGPLRPPASGCGPCLGHSALPLHRGGSGLLWLLRFAGPSPPGEHWPSRLPTCAGPERWDQPLLPITLPTAGPEPWGQPWPLPVLKAVSPQQQDRFWLRQWRHGSFQHSSGQPKTPAHRRSSSPAHQPLHSHTVAQRSAGQGGPRAAPPGASQRLGQWQGCATAPGPRAGHGTGGPRHRSPCNGRADAPSRDGAMRSGPHPAWARACRCRPRRSPGSGRRK